MKDGHRILRKYFCELIKACFDGRKPSNIPEGITENDLMKYACIGQIQYPILSSLLKTEISDQFKSKLVPIVKESTITTFLQVMTSKKISNELEKNGIRHQMLKGAVIKDYYPSPEMRQMSDIDLIVYEDSLDKTIEIVENMGFTNHGLIKHHVVFTNDADLCIEVHWCLIDDNVDLGQYLYFKDNFRAKLKDGTGYTYEFGIEDFYVYMIAHMAKHFFETGCGIRNLLDIYVYLKKFGEKMDSDYLKRELTNCGIFVFEKHMRKMAFIWLEDQECPGFYENLFSYMLDCGIYGKGENGIWSQLAKETNAENKNLKMHYYFPSYLFMREKYKWVDKRKYLLPLAWMIRFISALNSKEAIRHKEKFEHSSNDDMSEILEIYHTLGLNYRR